MHRTPRSLFLPLTLGLVLSFPFAGCTPSSSGGGSGGKSGTGGSSNGGSANGGSASGGSAKGGTTSNNGGAASGGTTSNNGGAASGGSAKGGTTCNNGGAASGGSTSNNGGSASGGSAKGGSSAGGSSSGGSGSGGSTGGAAGGGTAGSAGSTNVGGTSAGGAAGSAGSTGAGGAAGAGGTSSGTSTAPADMISDFEDTPGKATMDKNGGRTGYWYVYFPGSDSAATPASGMSISPALSNGSAVATEASDSGNALHVKGSGFNGSSTNYAGFGAAFTPDNPYDKKSAAYDVSAYTGITFKIKSGTGTPPATFFEVLTKDNQPTTSGGSLNPDGTAGPDRSIGLYNTRGWMLNTPWQTSAISTSWQQVTIPFGYLIPRHLTDSATCTSTASATALCQPPNLVPANVLGLQISFYAADKGWPSISGATPGTFDLWIDDVAFTKDDSGIETQTGFPLSKTLAGDMGGCKLPTGPAAYAKYLVPAYNQWKATFVKGGKVIRPENQNDTVSEGIAYGMLIALNFNDKTLFDSLYGTWKANATAGSLMTWCLGSGGGSTGTACSTSGGSATDADEDAAFALLQADKVFGGGYKSAAMTMIGDIWKSDIDGGGTLLPKGGSNYGSPSSAVTNPSYFAPAYYAAFKAAGDTNNWDGVISAVYKALNTSLVGSNSNGLYAAWCSGSCSAISKNNDNTDVLYQYDSHRIPMRIGLDYCFNAKSDAKTYVAKTTNFFATNANAGKNGIGRIFDVYDPTTNNIPASSVMASANNAASIIGTAAVGAMADGTNTAFINEAYQAVFDIVTRGSLDTTDPTGKTPYSYFNATVGLMTLLMMTGNFAH